MDDARRDRRCSTFTGGADGRTPHPPGPLAGCTRLHAGVEVEGEVAPNLQAELRRSNWPAWICLGVVDARDDVEPVNGGTSTFSLEVVLLALTHLTKVVKWACSACPSAARNSFVAPHFSCTEGCPRPAAARSSADWPCVQMAVLPSTVLGVCLGWPTQAAAPAARVPGLMSLLPKGSAGRRPGSDDDERVPGPSGSLCSAHELGNVRRSAGRWWLVKQEQWLLCNNCSWRRLGRRFHVSAAGPATEARALPRGTVVVLCGHGSSSQRSAEGAPWSRRPRTATAGSMVSLYNNGHSDSPATAR